MAASPVIQATALVKQFDDRVAVDGLDLAVPAGACFGLLGPNGAGKTTTLRMIYGVSRPTRGAITVFGLDVGDARPRRAQPARRDAAGERADRQPLAGREPARLRPLPPAARAGAVAADRASWSRSSSSARTRASARSTLSGGFKRRLAIAMSLINQPELLILDEPTTGLDPAVRHVLWNKVRELQGARHDRAAHDPLHGRGRAAVRPRADHEQRQGGLRGAAARAGREPARARGARARLHARRGARAARGPGRASRRCARARACSRSATTPRRCRCA